MVYQCLSELGLPSGKNETMENEAFTFDKFYALYHKICPRNDIEELFRSMLVKFIIFYFYSLYFAFHWYQIDLSFLGKINWKDSFENSRLKIELKTGLIYIRIDWHWSQIVKSDLRHSFPPSSSGWALICEKIIFFWCMSLLQ